MLFVLGHAPGLVLVASGQAESPADTRFYFISSGNKGGYESSYANPEGKACQLHLEFN